MRIPQICDKRSKVLSDKLSKDEGNLPLDPGPWISLQSIIY